MNILTERTKDTSQKMINDFCPHAPMFRLLHFGFALFAVLEALVLTPSTPKHIISASCPAGVLLTLYAESRRAKTPEDSEGKGLVGNPKP